jgi:hypothetical protein
MFMEFDSIDLAALERRGQLEQVILHEMAHGWASGHSGTSGPGPVWTL